MNTTELFSTTQNPSACDEAAHGNIGISTTVYATAAIQGTIAGLGILGNALVVFVLVLARDRQDSSSVVYVLNLAVSDFLFLVTVPFAIAQDVTLQWQSGDFMCKFAVGFLMYLNFFVSPLFLMVMSIDRYLAVNRPVASAELRLLRSSRFVCVAVWSIAVVAVLPTTFFHSSTDQAKCRPNFPGSTSSVLDQDTPFCELMEQHTRCVDDYVRNYTNNILSDKQQALTRSKVFETETTTSSNREVDPTAFNSKTFLSQFLNRQQTSTVETVISSSDNKHISKENDLEKLRELAGNICVEIMIGATGGREHENKCSFFNEPRSFHIWVVLNFFYSYLIPCSIIVVCYAAILRKLYRPSKIKNDYSKGGVQRQSMRRKVTQMVAMLVLSYIICFTPYYMWQLAKVPGVPVPNITVCNDVRRFHTTMAYLNSALNPILYTFLGEQFKPKFRLAFRRASRSTVHYRLTRIFTSRQKNSFTENRRRTPQRGAREAMAVLENVPNDNQTEERKKEKEKQSLMVEDDIGRHHAAELQHPQLSQDGRKKAEVASNRQSNRGYKTSSFRDKGSEWRNSSMFSCVKDCSSEEECPHCLMERNVLIEHDFENKTEDSATKPDDDVFHHQNKTSEPQKVENSAPYVSNNDSDAAAMEVTFLTTSGKFCKRHKKQWKESAKRRLNNYRSEIVKGPSCSSLRSVTNAQTDVTMIPPHA